MRTKRAAGAAVLMTGTLLLTACGSGGGEAGADGGDGGGTFSAYIGEPENPLIPGNTT